MTHDGWEHSRGSTNNELTSWRLCDWLRRAFDNCMDSNMTTMPDMSVTMVAVVTFP
jgi:hypothetical protein